MCQKSEITFTSNCMRKFKQRHLSALQHIVPRLVNYPANGEKPIARFWHIMDNFYRNKIVIYLTKPLEITFKEHMI